MKILSMHSTCKNAFVQKLHSIDRPHLWDDSFEEDQKYDVVVIGPGDEPEVRYRISKALSMTAGLILLEKCSVGLLKELNRDWTTSAFGEAVAVLLYLDKKSPKSREQFDYSCGYRSKEPVREVGCKPCQSMTGQTLLPIFSCSLLDCECSLASRELPATTGRGRPKSDGTRSHLVKACVACKDRVV